MQTTNFRARRRSRSRSWTIASSRTLTPTLPKTSFECSGEPILRADTLIAVNVYYRKYNRDAFNSNVNDDFDPVASPNQAINDASHTDTTTYGGSLQLSLLNDIGKHKNQFTPGLSVDRGDTDFEQFEQEADFTPNRGTVVTEDFELETKVNTRNRYYGIYFTDTISLSERLHLTASGRYNRAR